MLNDKKTTSEKNKPEHPAKDKITSEQTVLQTDLRDMKTTSEKNTAEHPAKDKIT